MYRNNKIEDNDDQEIIDSTIECIDNFFWETTN